VDSPCSAETRSRPLITDLSVARRTCPQTGDMQVPTALFANTSLECHVKTPVCAMMRDLVIEASNADGFVVESRLDI
jgi:hypothetical protein